MSKAIQHFFVPAPDGTPLPADDAERIWSEYRRKAESLKGTKAQDRRVHRLRMVHSEYKGVGQAAVGKLDPYELRELVLAIIELEDCFVIYGPDHGRLVGLSAMEGVDYFAPSA